MFRQVWMKNEKKKQLKTSTAIVFIAWMNCRQPLHAPQADAVVVTGQSAVRLQRLWPRLRCSFWPVNYWQMLATKSVYRQLWAAHRHPRRQSVQIWARMRIGICMCVYVCVFAYPNKRVCVTHFTQRVVREIVGTIGNTLGDILSSYKNTHTHTHIH